MNAVAAKLGDRPHCPVQFGALPSFLLSNALQFLPLLVAALEASGIRAASQLNRLGES